jgi:hypothetical protein
MARARKIITITPEGAYGIRQAFEAPGLQPKYRPLVIVSPAGGLY